MTQKLIFFGFFSVLGLAIAMWLIQGQADVRKGQESPGKKADMTSSTPQMSMKGVDIVDGEKGKPFFRIHIGRMEMSKKKVGFFRLGGANELNLWNVQLDLYIEHIRKLRAEGHKHVEQESHSGETEGSFFEEEVVGSLRMAAGLQKPVAGFKARNVRLRFHGSNGRVLQVRARSLVPAGTTGLMKLSGGVVLTKNGTRESCDQLVFDPYRMVLRRKNGQVLPFFSDAQRFKRADSVPQRAARMRSRSEKLFQDHGMTAHAPAAERVKRRERRDFGP